MVPNAPVNILPPLAIVAAAFVFAVFCEAAFVEEVMDYRTYCETMAGLLQKPIVKLLRNLKMSRNVKWIYQEAISISGRCSLACFNGKLQ